MKEVRGYIQRFAVTDVLHALARIEGLPVVVVGEVQGWTAQASSGDGGFLELPDPILKSRLEVVVPEPMVGAVVEAICEAAKTTNVFVCDITKPRS